MNEQAVIDLGARSSWVAIQIAAPALLATMLMGLLVSIFQAATQINEQTLSFIPKILAMTLALVAFGPWIIQILMNFTVDLIKSIPSITS